MTGREQERAIREFKKDGMKILIATQAAEEGLDIIDCEFVIRYSLPKTGVQRMQSKGRTRKEGSIYICLVQKGSIDEQMEEKSRIEEENFRNVMRRITAIRI